MFTDNYYKIGGSLEYRHPTYVVRQADCDLYEGLKRGEFCYVLNSRQMGKSSLRVRAMKQLQAEGTQCASIDLTRIGSHPTAAEWYGGIAFELLRGFNLSRKLDLNAWWQDRNFLPPVQRLGELIETVLFPAFSEPIIIFIDEIDSILKIEFRDDFFAFIRSCYNRRVDCPDYQRLTFCLLGVATPSDLIGDAQRTPFNIGRAIELTGFTLVEARSPLVEGLAEQVDNAEAVLVDILDWTAGQPFLTQKLCQIVAERSEGRTPDIEQLVRSYIVEDWEDQDEPEHLRTIRDRILKDEQHTIGLLGLYLQILEQGAIPVTDSPEQRQLQLAGLVVKGSKALRIRNRIYQSVFDRHWIEQTLIHLRPYADALTAWIASDGQDNSLLLGGQMLQQAQTWAEGKILSAQDYQFLAASQRQANELLSRIVWELVSPLEIEQVSPKVVDLLQRLQQASSDSSLALIRVESGSTILILESSQIGFERIQAWFETSQLEEKLGIPILSLAQRDFDAIAQLENPETLSMEQIKRTTHRMLMRWVVRTILLTSAAIGSIIALVFEFCLFSDICTLSFEGFF